MNIIWYILFGIGVLEAGVLAVIIAVYVLGGIYSMIRIIVEYICREWFGMWWVGD